MSDLVLSTDNVGNRVSVTAILVWANSAMAVMEHRVTLPEDCEAQTSIRPLENQPQWSVTEKN